MTPSKLKRAYQEADPDGHYFDRDTLRFFGDSMANYGVRSAGEYWELYRKRPVNGGLSGSHYFHRATLRATSDPDKDPVGEPLPPPVASIHEFDGKVACHLSGAGGVYLHPVEAGKLGRALVAASKAMKAGKGFAGVDVPKLS